MITGTGFRDGYHVRLWQALHSITNAAAVHVHVDGYRPKVGAKQPKFACLSTLLAARVAAGVQSAPNFFFFSFWIGWKTKGLPFVLCCLLRENESKMSKKRKMSDAKSLRPPYWQMKYAKDARARVVAQFPKGEADSVAFWGPSYAEADDTQRALRRALRYKGAGKYSWRQPAKYAFRGAGAIGGAVRGYASGGIPGAMSGAQEGWKLGAKASKYFGLGAYANTSENSLITGPEQHFSVNAKHNSGDIVFTNTEFCQNVYASIDGSGVTTSPFEVQTMQINPGLDDMFPFLSQIAQNFELYEFEGLMVEYRPTSGEYGNNGSNSLGKVIIATNYDAEASPFINSVQMENYDYANSCKPSAGLVHGIETHPDQRSNKMLYVRTGDSSKSRLFTDMGQLQIATEGVPFGDGTVAQTAMIGELWVTYKIRLSRSQLYGALLGNNIGCNHYYAVLAGGLLSSVDITAGGNLQCLIRNTSNLPVDGLTIEFGSVIDAGTYYVRIDQTTTSALVQGTLLAAPTNCGRIVSSAGGTGMTGNNVSHLIYVKVLAGGLKKTSLKLTLSSGNWANGGFTAVITQIPLAVYEGIKALNPSAEVIG